MANVRDAMKKYQSEHGDKIVDQQNHHGTEPSVSAPANVRKGSLDGTKSDHNYSEVLVAYHNKGGAIAEEYRSYELVYCHNIAIIRFAVSLLQLMPKKVKLLHV